MEGPIALTSCVKGSDESCAIESLCMLHGRWNPVNRALKTALENVMLSDMIPVRAALKPREAGEGVRL